MLDSHNSKNDYLEFEKHFVITLNRHVPNKSKIFWEINILDKDKPIRSQFTLSLPPENIRKPKDFLVFLGGRERMY